VTVAVIEVYFNISSS